MTGWEFRAGTKVIEFGCGTSGLGLVSFPNVQATMDATVRAVPRRDLSRMGVDLITGQTVSLVVSARPDERPLDEVWRELVAVWRADEVRNRSGVLATLTSDTGRKTYGRPRPISSNFKDRLFGLSRAELVFECVDDLWYGPSEITTVRFVPEKTGGLPVPAAVPFVLGGGTGEANYMLTVGGDVGTWPEFRLHGPILDPFIEIVGVGRLVFSTSLAHDQTLIVNTRDGWVKRDGAALPGALSPAGSRLSDMQLRPGLFRVFFGGYDPSGTSRLEVRVDPAFTSF